MTASQAQAARTLLGRSPSDLAQKADVQTSAIEGIEEGIHDASTLSAIKATFEAGIIFVGSTGVRLKHEAKGRVMCKIGLSNVSAKGMSSCDPFCVK